MSFSALDAVIGNADEASPREAKKRKLDDVIKGKEKAKDEETSPAKTCRVCIHDG